MSNPTPEPSPTLTVGEQRQVAFTSCLSCPAFIAVLLAAATFAVYWPAIGFDFINLDKANWVKAPLTFPPPCSSTRAIPRRTTTWDLRFWS